jgi:nitrogen fixation/metabolism regulation signal transduction histidine kinase
MNTRPPRLAHERRITYYALLAALPAVLVSMIILWTGDYSPKVQWTLTLLIVSFWLGFAFGVHERVIFPLRTLANLLAALREGDYSLRGRSAKGDALSEVMAEVNMMGEMLREQRLSALEATHLLRKVMAEIDVAILAFDDQGRLRLINRAGERLLKQPGERLLDRSARELGLDEYLEGPSFRTAERSFPGGAGRWRVGRSEFREHGVPHQLLVLSDLTRELREEELQAWQRLVRVLSHELNNSLAPIKSLTGSLTDLLARPHPPADWKEDMQQALAVIGSRADSLSRFTGAYARLARLPRAALAPLALRDWFCRVVQLETRKRVEVQPGPEVVVEADADQLEQLLINLIRNAVDAAAETGGNVRTGWNLNHQFLEMWVEDDGPGLPDDGNLFVPFFTTKPGGSGIGLVLCRKIAENHGGSVTLQNRTDSHGCRAVLRIPLHGTG